MSLLGVISSLIRGPRDVTQDGLDRGVMESTSGTFNHLHDLLEKESMLRASEYYYLWIPSKCSGENQDMWVDLPFPWHMNLNIAWSLTDYTDPSNPPDLKLDVINSKVNCYREMEGIDFLIDLKNQTMTFKSRFTEGGHWLLMEAQQC